MIFMILFINKFFRFLTLNKEKYQDYILRLQKQKREKLRKMLIKGFPGVEKLTDEKFYQFQNSFVIKKAKEGDILISEHSNFNKCFLIKRGMCSIWKSGSINNLNTWIDSLDENIK